MRSVPLPNQPQSYKQIKQQTPKSIQNPVQFPFHSKSTTNALTSVSAEPSKF